MERTKTFLGFILLINLFFFTDMCLAQTGSDSPVVMEYKYSDFGATLRREDYQVAVLTLALDKTISSYGSYKVTRVNTEFTVKRIRREISKGKIINIYAGAWHSLDQKEFYGIQVPFPLYKGLLGYRRLIIRKEDAEKFEKIRSTDELKKLVAGQAQGWVDTEIYRKNGYAVNNEGDTLNLLSMLKAKRIDYVPMTLVAGQYILDQEAAFQDSLIRIYYPMLFYPLPFIFYVSNVEPKLAERIEHGLEIAKKDGSFDALFQSNFAEEIAILKREKSNFFLLNNPSLPESLQIKPIFLK